MRTKLVQIGNSKGIRIPKPLLEEVGLDGEVDITIAGNTLVVSPVCKVRHDWSTAFAAMAERADDELLDRVAEPSSSWDAEEWRWE